MPRADDVTDDFNGDTETTISDSGGSAPNRGVRRATARRASRRRATARTLHGDEEAIIIDFLGDHPGSTAGDLSRSLNLGPEKVSTHLSHLANVGEITRTAHGYTMNDAADRPSVTQRVRSR